MKRLLSLGIFILVCSTAQAAFIDFRDISVIGVNPNGMSSVTFSIGGGVNLTVSASDFSGGNQSLFWDAKDGFGIRTGGYEVDEVEYPELLVLEFSGNVTAVSAFLTDFFANDNGNGYNEVGWWSSNPFNPDTDTVGVDFFAFTSTTIGSNGEFNLPLGTMTTTLFFSAPGRRIAGQNHEFSLGGLEIQTAQVPEPDSIVLLSGALLVGLTTLRKRLA